LKHNPAADVVVEMEDDALEVVRTGPPWKQQ
jgi:hypothetical protein